MPGSCWLIRSRCRIGRIDGDPEETGGVVVEQVAPRLHRGERGGAVPVAPGAEEQHQHGPAAGGIEGVRRYSAQHRRAEPGHGLADAEGRRAGLCHGLSLGSRPMAGNGREAAGTHRPPRLARRLGQLLAGYQAAAEA